MFGMEENKCLNYDFQMQTEKSNLLLDKFENDAQSKAIITK